jgi:hypothetical protein
VSCCVHRKDVSAVSGSLYEIRNFHKGVDEDLGLPRCDDESLGRVCRCVEERNVFTFKDQAGARRIFSSKCLTLKMEALCSFETSAPTCLKQSIIPQKPRTDGTSSASPCKLHSMSQYILQYISKDMSFAHTEGGTKTESVRE